MANKLYVVRWLGHICDTYESDIFKTCYASKAEASQVMLEDANNCLKVWKDDSPETKFQTFADEDGIVDYCRLWQEFDTFDEREWCIDEMKVK